MIWSGDADCARLVLFAVNYTSAVYFVLYIDIEFEYRKVDRQEGRRRREISRLALLVSRYATLSLLRSGKYHCQRFDNSFLKTFPC